MFFARSALGLLALACAGSAFAQGTITDGAATFVRTATPFDSTPTGNFTGVSATTTQDRLFETGWFFRVAGIRGNSRSACRARRTTPPPRRH